MRIHTAIPGPPNSIAVAGQAGFCEVLVPQEILPFRESAFRDAPSINDWLTLAGRAIDHAPAAVRAFRDKLAQRGRAEKTVSMLAFDLETLSINPVFNPVPAGVDPLVYAPVMRFMLSRVVREFALAFPAALCTVYCDALPTIWAMNGQHPQDKAAWDACLPVMELARLDLPSACVYLARTAGYTYTAAEWAGPIAEFGRVMAGRPWAFWTRLVYEVSGTPVPVGETRALIESAAAAGCTDLVIWETARSPAETAVVTAALAELDQVVLQIRLNG